MVTYWPLSQAHPAFQCIQKRQGLVYEIMRALSLKSDSR